MPDFSRKLTETVRILEESGHVFPADPEAVTQALHHVADDAGQKLIRRAQMIDRDGAVAAALLRAQAVSFWLKAAAALLLFCSGFSATYLLMDNAGLNFFLLLGGILGTNTLMLLLWLVFAVCRIKMPALPLLPTWGQGSGAVGQALIRLYGDEMRQPSLRWRLGALSHGLWLSALTGMLSAVLLLLLVRQYTFNWESTLLTDTLSVRLVAALSWLPQHLGLPVPDAQTVLGSRSAGHAVNARAWAGLLLGSIAAYGILPRAAAWAVCRLLAKLSPARLPLEQSYYRHILQQWQRQVVDSDDYQEHLPSAAPQIQISQAEKWAVMLETAWDDPHWFRHILGQEWQFQDTADSREKVAALVADLQKQPVQLLIGVRANTVPDRGVLRQIAQLAQAAQGGAVVQLLWTERSSDTAADVRQRLETWQQALNGLQLSWLNPPEISQKLRQAV
ncbi:DUF2868 domain-containing protein [Neisseria lisongii]|uniref:DUF2868 domain-containing protein n=1 Tax=Neisseria lisongii TaxID=2912188 RepID=A0AAW5AKK4_9NEIS|nr:DUF2868 domain-containing protein [Neisseria lisongii]MCF7530437.1 DUF2868 domain-containing protein [Neisseria lisongii]